MQLTHVFARTGYRMQSLGLSYFAYLTWPTEYPTWDRNKSFILTAGKCFISQSQT